MVEIRLAPGQEIIGEAGAMMYVDDGIDFSAVMAVGEDSDKGLMRSLASAGSRMLAGEKAFVTHFKNTSDSEHTVAFASETAGKILAINMEDVNGELLLQRDAFLCSSPEVSVSVEFQRSLGKGFFAGEGFILQKLTGEGQAFMSAGGMIIERDLKDEKVFVDTGCIVAFEPTLTYGIESVGDLKSSMFGGEGMYLATLEGTGKIWLQSMPISKLASTILSKVPGM